MIALILLLPLIVAILLLSIFKADERAKYIAIAGSLAGLLMLPFIDYGIYKIPWFSVSGYAFGLSIMVTSINFILLAIVLLISPIVLLYSFGFMDNHSEDARFYIELLAFEAAMLAFAMSGDLLLLFISWEFLSVISYLLIGFWNHKDSAVRSARKAITIILIGDIALLASIVMLWNISGSLEIITVFSKISTYSSSDLGIVASLLAIAVFTKSSQFPFHEWLPDAMDAPTPVSAFLHSTTIVKAGVFAAILFLPLFAATNTAISILLPISIVTIILSTLNALKETHIKRVLAYSTVQEIGLMLFGISIGAVYASLYFFIVQSFSKALLFFSSGVVMKTTETEDITETSGLRSNRIILITTLIAVLSLAGFFPLSGFFSNLLFGYFLTANMVAYAAITLVSLLTSFYIFRWFIFTLREPANKSVEMNYILQPRSMILSMVLILLPLLASPLAYLYLAGFLKGGTSPYPNLFSIPDASSGIMVQNAVIETLFVAAGLLASILVYRFRRSIKSTSLSNILYNGRIVRILYLGMARAVCDLSEGAVLFEAYLNRFIDYLGASLSRYLNSVRRLSSGSINAFALVISACLLALILYLYLMGIY